MSTNRSEYREDRYRLSLADALDMINEKVAHTDPGKALWKIEEVVHPSASDCHPLPE